MTKQQSFIQMFCKRLHAQILGLTQLPTSGRDPQTNGLVKQINRTLKQMFSKVHPEEEGIGMMYLAN